MSESKNTIDGHIGDLKPDPANTRSHNPRNIAMITDALQKVGAARSVVVDEDNVLLAGHGVVEAAAEAGIENVQYVDADGETIIAVRRTGLSDEQKTALSIFDNRTAELAEWNVEQLAEHVDAGVDVSAMWRDDELAELLADVNYEVDTGFEPDESANKGYVTFDFLVPDEFAEVVTSTLDTASSDVDTSGEFKHVRTLAFIEVCRSYLERIEG